MEVRAFLAQMSLGIGSTEKVRSYLVMFVLLLEKEKSYDFMASFI